jgi:hypothetical protein
MELGCAEALSGNGGCEQQRGRSRSGEVFKIQLADLHQPDGEGATVTLHGTGPSGCLSKAAFTPGSSPYHAARCDSDAGITPTGCGIPS